MIESWGRGIEKNCQACDEDGSPRPEYSINPGDIMIKFTAYPDRLIHPVSQKVTERVAEVTEKVAEITESEKEVLSLLLEDPSSTYAVLAEKLGVSLKTIFLKIKLLKEKGILKRIGSDTKGYWQINDIP